MEQEKPFGEVRVVKVGVGPDGEDLLETQLENPPRFTDFSLTLYLDILGDGGVYYTRVIELLEEHIKYLKKVGDQISRDGSRIHNIGSVSWSAQLPEIEPPTKDLICSFPTCDLRKTIPIEDEDKLHECAEGHPSIPMISFDRYILLCKRDVSRKWMERGTGREVNK